MVKFLEVEVDLGWFGELVVSELILFLGVVIGLEVMLPGC